MSEANPTQDYFRDLQATLHSCQERERVLREALAVLIEADSRLQDASPVTNAFYAAQQDLEDCFNAAREALNDTGSREVVEVVPATELAELVEAAREYQRAVSRLVSWITKPKQFGRWSSGYEGADDLDAAERRLDAALRPFTQEKRKALERIEQEGEAA